MSTTIPIEEAARRLDSSTTDLTRVTDFLNSVVTGDESTEVPLPEDNKSSSPTLKKMVKDNTERYLSEQDSGVVTKDNANNLQEQLTGFKIYPADITLTASITPPNNVCPPKTTALRDAYGGKMYKTSNEVEGQITALDFTNKTATVGGDNVILTLVTLTESVVITGKRTVSTEPPTGIPTEGAEWVMVGAV